MTTLINLYDINPPPMVELKDYNGDMLPKYINGREVLCYPNAGLPIYRDKTNEEFKKEIEPFEEFSNETYKRGAWRLDKDMKVGDVVCMSTGYRYTDFYAVSRLTKCFIVFTECIMIKKNIHTPGGDTITYGKYLGLAHDGLPRVIKKKIKYYENPNVYDGYRVYDTNHAVWIKSGETDIWR